MFAIILLLLESNSMPENVSQHKILLKLRAKIKIRQLATFDATKHVDNQSIRVYSLNHN